MWPLFPLYPHPQSPSSHSLRSTCALTFLWHILSQGLRTHPLLQCSSPDVHMTCWGLHSNVTPSVTTRAVDPTTPTCLHPHMVRSRLCLVFSLGPDALQHIWFIYLFCCHYPVQQPREHSGVATYISVCVYGVGVWCAVVTNAIINCARSLFIRLLSTITYSLVVWMTLKLRILLISGE